jgi:hypothetical protein
MEIRTRTITTLKAATLLAALCGVLLVLTTACSGNDIEVSREEIVVEGWIAEGGHPVVFVTSTLPITDEESKLDDLAQYVAQWARVGITTEDGTTTYLTGTYNPDFFPPYYFTTAAIRGEAGKRYHLTVDWRNHHAEATTTIPASVPIDDIWSGPCSDSDTLRQVFIRFHDRPVTHDYYLLFSRREGEPVNPQLCMFGLIDDVTLPQPEVTMSVRRGGLITEYETYTPYYSVGDDVEVSLLHVDSTTYAYWRGYADSKELGFSLLFNVTTPLDGNILGGHGIWYGCGMGRERLEIKD